MNEARRMQYLEAMGVDTFVPRFLLSNTLAPRLCVLPVESQPQAVAVASTGGLALAEVTVPKIESQSLRTLNEGLNSVLAELDLDRPSSRTRSKPTGKSSKESSSVPSEIIETQAARSEINAATVLDTFTVANFNLGMWFSDAGIQIIDSREPTDALPTETLLNNLLTACGLSKSVLPPMEVQVWPIPGPQEGDQSWSAACDMMVDFLDARFTHSPAKGIVVLGQAATKAILGETADFEALCFSTVTPKGFNLPVTILPALRALLYTPAEKRRIWSALKPQRQV